MTEILFLLSDPTPGKHVALILNPLPILRRTRPREVAELRATVDPFVEKLVRLVLLFPFMIGVKFPLPRLPYVARTPPVVLPLLKVIVAVVLPCLPLPPVHLRFRPLTNRLKNYLQTLRDTILFVLFPLRRLRLTLLTFLRSLGTLATFVPLNTLPPQHTTGAEEPNGTEHSLPLTAQHVVRPGLTLDILQSLVLTTRRTGMTYLELTTNSALTLHIRIRLVFTPLTRVSPSPPRELLHLFRHRVLIATLHLPLLPNPPISALTVLLPILFTER